MRYLLLMTQESCTFVSFSNFSLPSHATGWQLHFTSNHLLFIFTLYISDQQTAQHWLLWIHWTDYLCRIKVYLVAYTKKRCVL